ncbi:Response regulator mcs4 [Rhodotorula toruloides]|nr:Response regulator mcs4 [Rhodotorula toruloides]
MSGADLSPITATSTNSQRSQRRKASADSSGSSANSSNSDLAGRTGASGADGAGGSTASRVGRRKSRKSLGNSAVSEQPQPGTFLTRFLDSFRPSSSSASPVRPPLPRSLSSPTPSCQTSPDGEPDVARRPSDSPLPGAFPPSPGQPYLSPSVSPGGTMKRFAPSFRRSRSQAGSQKSAGSSSASPASSPGLAGVPPQLSPGSPSTLRGKERDPMDSMFGYAVGERPGRRGSMTSQMTVQAHDHAYTSGRAPGTPLEAIDEPGSGYSAGQSTTSPPRLEQSLDLIATLLPPALLLLSQLGPTHIFSPPLPLPSLFDATLPSAANRKASISSATGSNALLSSAASISSTATSSTTSASASFFNGLPTVEHLLPSYSHELHAATTLSMPAVSAAAVWRLFRGFEWAGEVGKGEQPLPPSPVPRHLGGQGGGPPLEPEEDPEQVFDFPSLIQGVADVLAADAAARGIELAVGQTGSGSAPSPAMSPGVAGGPAATDAAQQMKNEASRKEKKGSESRELLVRADERAWSVTLIWILHHILAGARSGSSVDIRFLATAATPPSSPDSSRPPSPSGSYHAAASPPSARPQKWWTVSLKILLTTPPRPASPSFIDETAAMPANDPLPKPPFDTAFARSLFSLVGLSLAPSIQSEATSQAWALEALLPAARPKTQSIAEDPSTILGRRRASLETIVGQEPSMNDLKRFADTALAGHKVALHAGENSAFARHLTAYLAGWGMDIQHVPLEGEGLSNGSGGGSPDSLWKGAALGGGRPGVTSRFDSGFETASTSPSSTSDGKAPAPPVIGEGNPSLVIIDDDVSTLRRMLISLRAPPLHMAPTLMAKRPQLATRRTRSSPHVRQLHQNQSSQPHSQQASQWVIVHFASLVHYKTIKEIVQDTLAMSKSPTLPEVIVVPKPAGPRRILTAIWTALKRPPVDPFLPPIATSPTSPGIQYWTPRLSPSLASKEQQEFDFSVNQQQEASRKGSDSSGTGSATGQTLGKPRTPPAQFEATGAGRLPPSPLGRVPDTADSYFSSVTEELKETTTSEGMIVQSPDGRSGIFFQPQPRGSRSSSTREKIRAGLDRSLTSQEIPEHAVADATSRPPSDPPSRVSTAAPHEIGLGSASSSRRVSSAPSHSNSGDIVIAPVASAPPGTPALTLDSFISAAKSRALGEDVSPEELPPNVMGEALSRQQSHTSSNRSIPTPSRRSLSGSSGSAGPASNATSPRALGGSQSPLYSVSRRGSGSGAVSPIVSPLPQVSSGAAAAGEAAARAFAAARARPATPSSPAGPAKARTRSSTMVSMPKNKRRTSRKSTIIGVPPISVLIVEDNPINQTILIGFMRKKGISFKVAKDGEQAVEMWKKGNFHLVLMDIQLPVKDGIEATREIRELERQNNVGAFVTTPTSVPSSPSSALGRDPLSTPGSPLLTMPVIIVALTASSLQADRVAALAAGCNDFLTKPVSLPWLESKLVEWGSMAYLSGFGRKSETPDSSVSSSALSGTPARPRSPARMKAPPGFSAAELASRADEVSQHLHIDRPISRSDSPSGIRGASGLASIAGSPSASPEPSPPSGAQTMVPKTATAHALGPGLQITSPTPDQTPGPVPAFPGVLATPAPSAGGDASETLDQVEAKLQSLVQEKEEMEQAQASPKRPGPTPLPPSVLTAESYGDPSLDDVNAEGQRLIEAGRARAGSASFGQAIDESGFSSAASSAQGSSENVKPA